MRKIFFRLPFIVVCWLLATTTFAQGNNSLDATMRSEGKIYVVMAVCLTILIGLFIYLISIDRKISKLEKNN
jgi:hypothetical protein